MAKREKKSEIYLNFFRLTGVFNNTDHQNGLIQRLDKPDKKQNCPF